MIPLVNENVEELETNAKGIYSLLHQANLCFYHIQTSPILFHLSLLPIFIFLELKIIEEIGQGAFGQVYKAVWHGTIVAAKEIPTAGNQDNVYRYGNIIHYHALLLHFPDL